MPTSAPRRQAKAFTVDHFRRYAETLVLDNGENWTVEDFQLEVFKPILAGVRETWAVLPEGQGKTTMMAAFALYHCDYTPSPWVPIAASSRDQAEILAQQAYAMIRDTPGMNSPKESLRRGWRQGDGRFVIFEGYRVIRSVRNGGRGIKVYAADAGSADGVIPTLCLCDEGHRWPDLGVYRLWKGKLNKRKGQIVMISTAGEPGGEFEETRDAIRNGAKKRALKGNHLRAEGPGIVMNEWAVQDPAKCEVLDEVVKANPFSGITKETLSEEFHSLTFDLGDWKRLKCNVPSRSAAAAITELEWARAYRNQEIPQGAHIMLGVDVAWKHDTFAIQPLWPNEEEHYRLLGAPKVLPPPRDGTTLSVDDVKVAFEFFLDLYLVDAAIFDLERAEDVAQWLEDEKGVNVVDRPQGNALAVEDYDAFMKGLRNGQLEHNGDATLRRHVMNAIARTLPGDKKRFDRPSQSRAKRKQAVRVIDALTAAGMVNYEAGEFGGNDPLVAWR